jgi:cellobiose phosphorylase
MLANRYGRFDASGTTFSIHDHRTPTPWVNVVCNERYGFVVSQNGGGFSWLDNSQLNVVSRWDMDLVRDDRGRFLYLADLDSGEVWSLSPAPCWPTYKDYRCDHRPGSTTFVTEVHGVRAEWTLAVPPGKTLEVWHAKVTNTGSSARRLRIASFLEWCCGVAPDTKREFHRLFITVTHDAGRRAIVAEKNMWDVPDKNEKEHWNKPWPYVAAHALVAGKVDRDLAIGDKWEFLGRYGEQRTPAAMRGDAIVGGMGRFGDAAACIGGDFALAAGATAEFGYTVAIDPTREGLLAQVDSVRSIEAVKKGIEDARGMWDTMLARTTVDTGAADFDVLNNTWLPYQAISGRLWARTGYYQQSGAFGFRDQLQDSQVWLPIDPKRTHKQIMLHAAHQFVDGSVYHWWHPLVEFGNHTACSDDYLWLPFLVSAYIRETGDASILSETAPFVDDAKHTTIKDHCLRSIARSYTRMSPRGLPHIGSCDWNDGLSAVGVEEKGESVWLAFFIVGILRDFGHVLREAGDAATAADFEKKRQAMVAAINDHAWDGAWYRGCTKDNGEWLGTKTNSAGKIFLNCQTWAVLTDSAPAARVTSAWDSVKQHLLGEMGPLLLAPAYTVPDPDIGYITRYSPGSRENGGVYMHAATWALMCAAKLRDAEAVAQIWRAISPPLRGQDADRYRAEPYVTPGNVDGPLSDTPGKAGWTWYTGSAAWLNRVSLEWILGIRPEFGGLRIDPVPFPELGRVDVSRVWRGRKIRVRFDAAEFARAARSGQATPTLLVGGRPHEGTVLTVRDIPEGGTADVEVKWEQGKPAATVVAANPQETVR